MESFGKLTEQAEIQIQRSECLSESGGSAALRAICYALLALATAIKEGQKPKTIPD